MAIESYRAAKMQVEAENRSAFFPGIRRAAIIHGQICDLRKVLCISNSRILRIDYGPASPPTSMLCADVASFSATSKRRVWRGPTGQKIL